MRTDCWLVAFVPAPNRFLWRLFAGRGAFAHCIALRWVGGHAWLCVDPTAWGLNVRLIEEDSAFEVIELAKAHGHLLRVRSRRRRLRWWPPFLFSCSGVIVLLLGLDHNIWTPRGLYRHLMRDGAEEI